jgi:hypothetical protein
MKHRFIDFDQVLIYGVQKLGNLFLGLSSTFYQRYLFMLYGIISITVSYHVLPGVGWSLLSESCSTCTCHQGHRAHVALSVLYPRIAICRIHTTNSLVHHYFTHHHHTFCMPPLPWSTSAPRWHPLLQAGFIGSPDSSPRIGGGV